MSKKNKVLVTDLDGTLVKDSKVVTQKDKEALKQLNETYILGIATGRSLKEILYIEEMLGFHVPLKIAFNGACVTYKDNIIYESPIDPKTLKEVLAFIEKQKIVFDALDGEDRIGTHKEANSSKLWNMKLIEPNHLFDYINGRTIYKINIRPEDHRADELLEDLRATFPDLSICKSGPRRIEVTAQNVSKGFAIAMIRDKLPLEVIAVGDSENDISMFKEADVAISMSEADDSVKEEADVIINDFYEASRRLGD